MRIEYLREFLSIAEKKNYMESAESQFVSQAALSRHIQSLEAEMNVELFNRSTRKVSLTAAGERIRPYAQQLVDLYDDLNNEIAKYRPEEKKTLLVGYSDEIRLTNLLNLLLTYRTQSPEADITLTAANRGSAIKMILRRTLDCSCVSEDELIDDPRLGRICLFSDRLVVAVPKNHALAQKTTVSLEQLCREKLILYHANVAVNNLFAKKCAEAGLSPDITLYTTIGRDVYRMVELGVGVGIVLSQSANREEDAKKVAILDIDPPMDVDFYFVYNNRGISEPLANLIDVVNSYVDSLE